MGSGHNCIRTQETQFQVGMRTFRHRPLAMPTLVTIGGGQGDHGGCGGEPFVCCTLTASMISPPTANCALHPQRHCCHPLCLIGWTIFVQCSEMPGQNHTSGNGLGWRAGGGRLRRHWQWTVEEESRCGSAAMVGWEWSWYRHLYVLDLLMHILSYKIHWVTLRQSLLSFSLRDLFRG